MGPGDVAVAEVASHPVQGLKHRPPTVASMRRFPAALAGALVLVVIALSNPGHAAAAVPAFTTVQLPGTSGRAEPRASVTDDGLSYLATSGSDAKEAVFRSTDGLTWTPVTTPPDQTEPTTDVDTTVLPSGRLVTVELDGAGINFITAYSDDKGVTWTSSLGTTFADTDRPWLAAGPDDHVYLLLHNLFSGLANHNMYVSTSTDGGATFGPLIPVSIPTQQDYLDLQCGDSGGPSSIWVDQHTGKVSVSFGTRSSALGGCGAMPTEVSTVATERVWVVSAAAADTQTPGAWVPSLAEDDTSTGQISGIQFSPGAVDDAGNAYVVYAESPGAYPDYDGASIKLVHSTDGVTWSAPLTIAAGGGAGNFVPQLVAGDAGKVDVTYFHGNGDGTWVAEAAQVLDALDPSPVVSTVQLSKVQVETGDLSTLAGVCMSGPTTVLNGVLCARATDDNGIALDACGRLLSTWPAQAGLATDATYVSQQTSGPRLRTAACPASAGVPVVVAPGRAPAAPTVPTVPARPASGSLAATGADDGVLLAALAAVVAGFVVRRRARR